MTDAAVEVALTEALGVPVRAALAEGPAPLSALSDGELEVLERFETQARRTEWRRGRAALKRLLARLGEGDDTAQLRFPHPRVSLTHAGKTAVAVAVAGAQGVGVDLECDKTPHPETARFFLTDEERSWLRTTDDLVRLWTIKEALFKADADNAGAGLYEYELDAPDANTARRGAQRFRFATHRFPFGTLTVAVREESC
jgi:phosphopantetheinyl transferase